MRRRRAHPAFLSPRLAILAMLAASLAIVAHGDSALAASARQTGTAAPAAPVSTPGRPPDAEAGMMIFAERCAECHGMLGRGDGALAGELPDTPPSFADQRSVRSLAPEDAFEVVTEGRLARGMPPWRDELTVQERWDAVAGAWSFALTPDRLARGRDVWQARCAACHSGDAPVGDGGAFKGQSAAWPPPDLLSRSGDSLMADLRAAGSDHDEIRVVRDDELWLALDFGRSAFFRPLPFDRLSTGGAVTGLVVNGTESASDAVGAEIRLVPFAGAVPGEPVIATTGADGTYRAEDLVVGPDVAHRAIATYRGVEYVHPDKVDLTSGSPERSGIDFTVFEPSSDVPLAAKTAHMVAEAAPDRGVVSVTEVWVVENGSDVAFVPDESGTLRFLLPQGAHALTVEDPRMRSRSTIDGSALVDHLPVPPGEREIVFRYDVPYRGRSVTLSRQADLDVGELNIFATNEGARVIAEGLEPSELLEVGDATVAATSARDVAAGTPLTITFDGLPESRPLPGAAPDVVVPLPESAIGTRELAALSVVVAALGIAVAFLVPGRVGGTAATLRAYDGAIRDLAALDDLYAVGGLTDRAYSERRARLLDRAIAASRYRDGGAQ